MSVESPEEAVGGSRGMRSGEWTRETSCKSSRAQLLMAQLVTAQDGERERELRWRGRAVEVAWNWEEDERSAAVGWDLDEEKTTPGA